MKSCRSLVTLVAALALPACTYEVTGINATPYGAYGTGAAVVTTPVATAPAVASSRPLDPAVDGGTLHARVCLVAVEHVALVGPDGTPRSLAGGSIVFDGTGLLAGRTIIGGTILVREQDPSAVGGRVTVVGGTVQVEGLGEIELGAGQLVLSAAADNGWSVSTGTVTLAHAAAVESAAEAGGSLLAFAMPGAATAVAVNNVAASATVSLRTAVVAVRRLEVGGALVVRGHLTIAGLPDVRGLEVIDGTLTPADGAVALAGTAGWEVGSGVLLIKAPDGRRWRVSVQGGRVAARRAGGARAHVQLVATGGSIHVHIEVAGDASLALSDGVDPGAVAAAGAGATSAAPAAVAIGDGASASVANGGSTSANVNASANVNVNVNAATSAHAVTAHVTLRPNVLAALDQLVRLAPAGSAEAARLAAAVEIVVDGATTNDAVLFDAPIVGHTVVLTVDLSYSMGEPDPAAPEIGSHRALPSKLDVARAELVKLLASLPAGTAVDVIGFSSDLHPMWTTARALDPASLAEAIRWVFALRPLDETDPAPAVESALALHADQVILVTDGRPTQADRGEAALLTLADRIHAQGARLDAVGLGPDQDTAFLDRLAARARGVARHR